MVRHSSLDGRIAEKRASLFLKFLGWQIVARNVRTAYERKTGEKRTGEIDIIAHRQPIIAFIEVKARPHMHDAMQAVSPHQQSRIVRAAEAWLGLNPRFIKALVRFDCVICNKNGLLTHIPDAWRP